MLQMFSMDTTIRCQAAFWSSARAWQSTAIISIRSCVWVMRFLVFLTGLDTAESIAFIITHALNITTEYKKQNILDTYWCCACVPSSSLSCDTPVSMPHLLEYSSESLSCMLVANPINFSSGRRSTASDFSLPLFFFSSYVQP